MIIPLPQPALLSLLRMNRMRDCRRIMTHQYREAANAKHYDDVIAAVAMRHHTELFLVGSS